MEILPQYLLAIAFGMLLGPYFHEGSHWFVGLLGNTDPKPEWRFIFPVAVNHGKIETVDPMIIRLSGLSIFLWIPPGVLAAGNLLLNPSPAAAFTVTLPLGILLTASESDVVALRNPERFRDMWMNDEFEGNGLILPV